MTKNCVLCDRQSEALYHFQLSAEARAFFETKFPGVDPEQYLAETGICESCQNLSPEDREKAAERAKERILSEVAAESLLQRKVQPRMIRGPSLNIDIAKTIERVTFPAAVCDWLNLLGDVLILSQNEAKDHDDFAARAAVTPFNQILVPAIHRDLSSLSAIYTLLRCESIHQAAAQVRLFCESVITLHYIAKDKVNRAQQFFDYAFIDAFNVTQAVLQWESGRAKPVHVKQLEAVLVKHRSEYERVKPTYTYKDRNGKERVRNSWTPVNLFQQAAACGEDLARLYRIVYSQLSAYVHRSMWSLRRQHAYSVRGYNS